MPADPGETDDLFAIRYATREARRSDHFIGGDAHGGPVPMDYFMWLAVGRERVATLRGSVVVASDVTHSTRTSSRNGRSYHDLVPYRRDAGGVRPATASRALRS